jgi:hypothetical protein
MKFLRLILIALCVPALALAQNIGSTPSAKVLANERNALAPRGAVYFDGSANDEVYSALTNQSIGTDPFSISIVFTVPSTAPTSHQSGVAMLSPNQLTCANYNAFAVVITLAGNLEVVLMADSADENVATCPLVSSYGGKTVNVTIVRPYSGNLQLYINGIQQTLTFTTAGTPPGWQGNVASTYFGIGYDSQTEVLRGKIYSATLYNLALSASDAEEIFELGNAVPDRFRWGSQADRITGDSQTFTASVGSWVGVTDTIAEVSGSMNVTVNSGGYAYLTTSAFVPNKANRVRFSYQQVSGTAALMEISDTSSGTPWIQFTPTGAVQTFDGVIDLTYTSGGNVQIAFGSGVVAFDNFRVQQVGAICHFRCDDGVGYQLSDASSNALHATISAAGVTHSIAQQRGVVRFTTNTSGNQQALGQVALPSGARVMSWTIDNTSGSAVTVSLGSASGGTQYANSVSVASGENDITLATRYNGSGGNLWVNASSTATLLHTIYYDLVQ